LIGEVKVRVLPRRCHKRYNSEFSLRIMMPVAPRGGLQVGTTRARWGLMAWAEQVAEAKPLGNGEGDNLDVLRIAEGSLGGLNVRS
jgi:hypothetical protein